MLSVIAKPNGSRSNRCIASYVFKTSVSDSIIGDSLINYATKLKTTKKRKSTFDLRQNLYESINNSAFCVKNNAMALKVYYFILLQFLFFSLFQTHWHTLPHPTREEKQKHKKLTATELDHRLTSCKKCRASGSKLCVYVVVNSLSQVIFLFLLFLVWQCMLMKLKQKKNKNYLR